MSRDDGDDTDALLTSNDDDFAADDEETDVRRCDQLLVSNRDDFVDQHRQPAPSASIVVDRLQQSGPSSPNDGRTTSLCQHQLNDHQQRQQRHSLTGGHGNRNLALQHDVDGYLRVIGQPSATVRKTAAAAATDIVQQQKQQQLYPSSMLDDMSTGGVKPSAPPSLPSASSAVRRGAADFDDDDDEGCGGRPGDEERVRLKGSDDGDDGDYDSRAVVGCGTKRLPLPATWRTVLAALTVFVCPVFGVLAFALAVVAENRMAAATPSTASRHPFRESIARLRRCSVLLSTVGIAVFLVLLVLVAGWFYGLASRPPTVDLAGPSGLPTCPYRVDAVCYRYRIYPQQKNYCGYGLSFGGYCHYDARYRGRAGHAQQGADEICDRTGADLSPDDQYCYYIRSPAACSQSAAFANGICYAYNVPASASVCRHGFYVDGHCRYDTRYLAVACSDSRDCCDNQADHLGKFCYHSSATVCQYAANFIDGRCMPFAFDASKLQGGCQNGRKSADSCFYDQRKEPQVAPARPCSDAYADIIDGYCYYTDPLTDSESDDAGDDDSGHVAASQYRPVARQPAPPQPPAAPANAPVNFGGSSGAAGSVNAQGSAQQVGMVVRDHFEMQHIVVHIPS